MAGQSAFGFIWPLVKMFFFVRFLGELKIPKTNFEINWPLVEIKSHFQSHHMDRKGKVNCPWSYQKKIIVSNGKELTGS